VCVCVCERERRLLCQHLQLHSPKNLIFRLSSLTTYYIPKDGPLSSYKEYISMLPNMDHPEAFGQHPNADITSQIQVTKLLFDTLLSLQPQVATVAGERREDKVCIIGRIVATNLFLLSVRFQHWDNPGRKHSISNGTTLVLWIEIFSVIFPDDKTL